MQPVQQFLQGYFRDRTELLRQSCGGWESHAERFFAPAYQPYDRAKTVADSEAESISTVTSNNGSTEVITTGFTGGRHRFRYRLATMNEKWAITSMEMECGICRGSGKSKGGQDDCKLCKGAGWKLIGEVQGA